MLDDNQYINLSELSENTKKEFLQEFVKISGHHFLKIFLSLGLKTHIETMIIHEETGDEFILSFKKVKNNTK